jgi:hypothetical protein
LSQAQPPPQPGYPPPSYPGGATGQTNGLAIAGMILGIASLVLFFLSVFAAIIGVVGLILSFIGLNKSKQMGGTGRGMAIAGIVTSAAGIAIGVILFIIGLQAASDLRELEDLLEQSLAR